MHTGGGNARPRVGMVLYGDLTYDSRVRREARSLALSGFDVVIACLAHESTSDDLPPQVSVVVQPISRASAQPGALNPFRAPGQHRAAALVRGASWFVGYSRALRSWGHSATAACGRVDAWHAHDLTGLVALAPRLGGGIPIVYDAHDLLLESGTALRLPSPARRLLQKYERHLVSRVVAVVTVNRGLAGVIRRRYRPKRIEILHNFPDRWTPPVPRPRLIRDAAGIPEGAPIILGHGLLGPGRGIEQVMQALLLPGLESAHVVLMGFGAARGQYAADATRLGIGKRFHLLDAVPPSDLLRWVASADVGAVLHPGTKLNDRNKTPNKLFECIAAGTPVVASHFPLMRDFVVDDPAGALGVLCDPSDVEDIASALRSILGLDPSAMESMRARCIAAAQERLNWQAEVGGLASLYRELVGEPA
jgi:glycosyltransferase involved in cell wall biosynthesis